LLAALLLSGCGGTFRGPEGNLTDQVRRYNEAVLWQNVGGAAHFVPSDQRKAFVKNQRDQLATRHVTEYTIREVRPGAKPDDEALVVVESSWYGISDTTLHTEVRYQQWRYRDRQWWMVGELKDDPAEQPDQNGMGSSSNPPPGPPPPGAPPPPPGPESPQPPPPPP
jgi:hypothetical protein